MKKTIITLLATAALAAPAFAANQAANQPPQQPQAQQSQNMQQQPQAKSQDTRQQAQAQAQPQEQNQQPNNLSRSEVRQMQAALDKRGFNAGKPDGKLGPRTKQAVEKFDQKKGIQSNNGQPTEQTLAQLGINTDQNQNGNQQQPNQNGR